MATGGFKQREQALNALTSGAIDMVGLALAMVINPQLAKTWLTEAGGDPVFPKFATNPPGGITAWYTMRLKALGKDEDDAFQLDLSTAIQSYEERDAQRCLRWRKKFMHSNQ